MSPGEHATEKVETLKRIFESAKNLISHKVKLLSDYRKAREAAKINEIKKTLQS